MWGIFKPNDANCSATGGEPPRPSNRKESYRSVPSGIELDLWTIHFTGSRFKVYDIPTAILIAGGTVAEETLTFHSQDGTWSVSADYGNGGRCFDGAVGLSRRRHGIRIADDLTPSGTGTQPREGTWICDLQQDFDMALCNAVFECDGTDAAGYLLAMMSAPDDPYGTLDDPAPFEDAACSDPNVPCAEGNRVEGGMNMLTHSRNIGLTVNRTHDFPVGNNPETVFNVSVESGRRKTIKHTRVKYDLYVPEFAPGLPAPPYPAVILTHGFARNRKNMAGNAWYMAERGIITMTPDMTNLIYPFPKQARQRNILILQDHAAWLSRRAETPGDSLYGILDPHRIALAGYSAGGAISFEAAINMQNEGPNIAALCLLDAVPYNQTVELAPTLKELPFCSLRSDPSACNKNGYVLELLANLSFPVQDVHILGATHCDVENPANFVCKLVCGGDGVSQRAIYQRLLYLFFQVALDVVSVEAPPQNYAAALDAYEISGEIEVVEAGMPVHPGLR